MKSRALKPRIYLDYAATTPVDPAVLRAMEPYFTGKFGNPGSLHSFGQEAIAAVDHAREIVAAAIGAEFREIIFTSSTTEANNLALRGVVRAADKLAGERTGEHAAQQKPQVIVSAIEHESVLEAARELERDGVEVVCVPVDGRGIVNPASMKKALNERTVFVSVMYANNEIGTIQPIAEIAAAVRAFRAEKNKPFFHVDAAQAFQFLDCNVEKLGIDLMTLSSHKIYGPKGAAALYVRDAVKTLRPLVAGGGQEFGFRSGTENVPAIVGFAKAVELAGGERAKEAKRVAALKKLLWCGIKKIYPDAEVNGDAAKTLPNILNVYLPGRAAQDMLTKLDLAGVAVSSGSACRSRAMESSYVIEALGYSRTRAKESLRFSFGRPTGKDDIAAALRVMQSF